MTNDSELSETGLEFEDEDDEGGYDVADHSDRDDDEINGKTE